MNGHLNFHVSHAYEAKISSPHLLHQLAKKALSKVPGSNQAIAKHFKMSMIQSDLKPPPPRNLIYHSGVGTV